MKKILLVSVFLSLALLPRPAFTRENVTDWYVKDFKTTIDVQNDSSLDITETILADCGQEQKHGIFRTLPTFQQISDNEKMNSPVKLISITDQQGNNLKFQTINDRLDKTVTWKIGDPNKYVTGENTYVIKYRIGNAVRHNSNSYDELYWNLSGNFWQLEIDNFEATVNFPEGLSKNNINLDLYSGNFGATKALDVSSSFVSDRSLKVSYTKTLLAEQGITLSASFPKNIISPYKPGFWELYGPWLYLIIPIAVLLFCLKLWRKYGKDPSINPTIAPEFEIPQNLAPIEMGVLLTDGLLKNNFVSASIINLAVNNKLKITKLDKKGLFGREDFELTKLESKYKPSPAEKKLLESLFENADKIRTSELENKFYKKLPQIGVAANGYLVQSKYLLKNSRVPQYIMLCVGIVTLILSPVSFGYHTALGVCLVISGLIFIVFSFIMPRRTLEGAEMVRRVQGFRLYMDKAEKYRQQVLEKTNTFEKLLPYAIMFGMTKQYIQKMKNIYSEEYFAAYHPVWFYYAGARGFDIDQFTSQISGLSSSMASSLSSSPSSSGAGGGGFAGGGGGGGGGGGW